MKKLKPRWHYFAPRSFLKIKIPMLIILALLLLIMAFPFFPRLVLINGDNQIVYKSAIKPLDEFSIKFIHSIHLTPVEEFYRIDTDYNILLDELHFDTYSVGMPSELNEGEVLELTDGKIIIKNMNRKFEHIDLRVGQVIANHTLTRDNVTVQLSKIVPPGSAVRIQTARLSIYQLLRGRF